MGPTFGGTLIQSVYNNTRPNSGKLQLVREWWFLESSQDLFGNSVPIEAGERELTLEFLDRKDSIDESRVATELCREDFLDLLVDEFRQAVIALEIEMHVLVEEVIPRNAVGADRFEFAFRINEVNALRSSIGRNITDDFIDAVVRSESQGIQIARQSESPLRFNVIANRGVTTSE